jgi:hypothetical protein
MTKVEMSAQAVTARLKRISQLRRLCLSLRKTRFSPPDNKPEKPPGPNRASHSNTRKTK